MEQGRVPPTGVVGRWFDFFLQLPSGFRRFLITSVFLLELAVATYLAFLVRFDGSIPNSMMGIGLAAFGFTVLPYLAVFLACGAHRGLWAFSGMHDFIKIPVIAVAGGAGSYALVYGILGRTGYPRSIYFLTAAFIFILMALDRGGFRLVRQLFQSWGRPRIPVVIFGAGRAGEMLVRDMRHSGAYAYRPVAFIDRDPSKKGSTIHGIPVVGNHRALPAVIERYHPKEIIIAIPSVSPAHLRGIVEACQPLGLPIKVLPSVQDILHGHLTVSKIRPLSLADLLSREAVPTESSGLDALIEGKRVLVTGAGGSIGSELCRQIAKHRPQRLVLVERYENNLYAIDTALRDVDLEKGLDIRACLADVLDQQRMERLFAEHRPHLVFHAAAHKHVPIVEDNPTEGVLNNIVGTYRVAMLSKQYAVDRMILVSTDKAVNPANVMGVTKRFAEYIVRALSESKTTRFITVRFGNVLGSNGSVVPRFQQQIERGGPVTVTHPDIERYFMLIPEAVHLILEAAQRGQGGDVFVLDMGDPVKIVDLAHNMIRLAGYIPNEDIAIEFTGLRPGEKLFEELFDKEERVEQTSHPKLKKAVSRSLWSEQELVTAVGAVTAAVEGHCKGCLQEVLQWYVLSYQPSAVSGADGRCVSKEARHDGCSKERSIENGHRSEIEHPPSRLIPPRVVEEAQKPTIASL